MYTAPAPLPTVQRSAPTERAIAFTMRFAAALHRFGVPAQRLEPMLAQVAEQLGLDASFFVEPTSIQASFVTERGSETRFARVEPGADDLERLARLDDLARRLGAGDVALRSAERELEDVLAAPPRWPAALELAAFAAASAAAARFFGGGLVELACAAVAGLLTGALAWWSHRHPRTAPIFEGAAAFAVALAARLAARAGVPLDIEVTVLAGLIVLLPGLTLTLAMTELATRHLASGVARLAAAGVSFGSIAFGVVLAQRVATAAFGPAPDLVPVPLAAWTLWPTLALAPFAFAVLLRAAPRDLAAIALACPLAFVGARLGAVALGPELGAFVGATLVAIASNVAARLRERPASVTLVPAVLLLVPGSLGFRSLDSLLRHDWTGGLDAAVRMLTVALALVAGLLVANVVAPPRRAL